MSKALEITVPEAVPTAVKPNSLLNRHGPSGWLILRLQRYALLGWLAFFLLAGVFVLYVFVERLAPQAVLAVDEGGRVLGQFEYLSPEVRTDQELIAGAMFFIDRYLSVNSATVYHDYSAALNMMSEPLRKQKIAEVKKTGYLTQIDQARSRSYLEYFENARAPTILWRRGLQTAVRLRGSMVMIRGDQTIERPFDLTVEMTLIARNTLATQGLVIDAIRNN